MNTSFLTYTIPIPTLITYIYSINHTVHGILIHSNINLSAYRTFFVNTFLSGLRKKNRVVGFFGQ